LQSNDSFAAGAVAQLDRTKDRDGSTAGTCDRERRPRNLPVAWAS